MCYFDNEIFKIAKAIKSSERGELETTDINKAYLDEKLLDVGVLSRCTAWLDTGTFDSLHEASEFVKVIEKRQGFKISCIEEIAYRSGFVDKDQLISACLKIWKKRLWRLYNIHNLDRKDKL